MNKKRLFCNRLLWWCQEVIKKFLLKIKRKLGDVISRFFRSDHSFHSANLTLEFEEFFSFREVGVFKHILGEAFADSDILGKFFFRIYSARLKTFYFSFSATDPNRPNRGEKVIMILIFAKKVWQQFALRH